MLRQTLMRLSQEQHVRDFATHNGVARGMAQRFVAGETLEDALRVVSEISARGLHATLDHLGENVASREEALEATRVYCSLLEALASAGADCNASLKLTQLGLDLGDDFAYDNVHQVVALAAQKDNFIRVDMEGSPYTDRTLMLVDRLWSEFHNVGTVIQANLYRSANDLERLIDAGVRIRLVKGAYLEPPDIAFARKADVDANYVRLAQMLLDGGTYPAFATHDPAMIEAVNRYASAQRIARDRYEFQMLYGIRRDLQLGLAAQGFPVRVYVPYGTHWYPYLMRRMAERPANVMFVLNNLAREVRAGR